MSKLRQKKLNERELFALIDKRNRRLADRKEIDNLICKKFLTNRAIMITDSVGFTRRTYKHGIIQFLAVMKRIHDRLRKMIKANGGIVLGERADNFLALFESPGQAIATAIKLNQYLSKYNRTVAEKDRYELCTGIGYGPVLYAVDCVYGLEVNLSSKLGEDLAKGGEVLITENAYRTIKRSRRYKIKKPKKIRISAVSFQYYKIIY